MSNVNLSIGGRNFAVACADGEEDHIAALGRLIDSKLRAMGDLAAQSESRMLLFATLLLADEVHEARSAKQLAAAAPPAPKVPADLGERLAGIAGQLENLANRLESGSTSA